MKLFAKSAGETREDKLLRWTNEHVPALAWRDNEQLLGVINAALEATSVHRFIAQAAGWIFATFGAGHVAFDLLGPDTGRWPTWVAITAAAAAAVCVAQAADTWFVRSRIRSMADEHYH